LQRREFLQLLAAAAALGLRSGQSEAQAASALYDLPPYGNVSLLHITDVHAQLLPIYFREPGNSVKGDTALAYAFSSANFEALARRYGKVGGMAHLSTLIRRIKTSRPHALLLDGGDSWQGSATALWSKGADMVGVQQRLGVEYMTAHWEFTYGGEHVKASPVKVLAQNVRTADFEEPVFEAYALREMNGVPVGIIGQAYPYTPIANPRHFVPEWTFGIQERLLQHRVDEVRAKGARAVVLLSHNGLGIDLKLASRVRGVDAILGGHTHDALPREIRVGKTVVTNGGSNGKFLGVLDLQVGKGGVTGYRYRLLPVFSNLLNKDPSMSDYVDEVRKPFREKLEENLAVTEGTLYRRGSFNGTFDQLIVETLLAARGAQIAFSPGFRWGTTLLPGDAITLDHVMDQTAITYPQVTLNELTGAEIKAILEDVADNLFNPDPYLQQGGDMVRTGGLRYAIAPRAKIGSRVSDLRLGEELLEATKRYKVAGWASVAEGITGEPAWDLVSGYLRARRTIPPLAVNRPRLVGVKE
jgi:S-sulfosulfanyl-L-cysteine sulfohydrolase